MSPPTDQLVHDYLSRMSAAARGKLTAADRRALVLRTRYFIQQMAGQAGAGSAIEVARLLSGLGDPASIVAQEQARLAEMRGESALSAADRPLRPGRLPWRQQGQASWHWPSQPAGSPQLAHSLMAAADDSTAPWQRDPAPPGKTGLLFRLVGRPAGRPPWTAQRAAADGSRRVPSPASDPLTGAASRQDDAIAGVVTGNGNGEAAGMLAAAELADRPSWPSVVARAVDAGPGNAGPGGSGVGAATGADWLDRLGFSPRLDTAGNQAANGVTGSASAARAAAGVDWLSRLAIRVVGRFRKQPVESAAAALLGIGGAAYPPVWLLGAVVALTSRVWDYRDKWAGLALPVLVTIVGTVVGVSLTGTSALGHDVHNGWLFADVLSRVAAFAGASYLARRAVRGRRRPVVPPWDKPHEVG